MELQRNLILDRKNNKPILIDVFFKNDEKPKPIVIFCHGYKGFKDWGAWDLMAENFSNVGFFFIKFNFSHNGGTIEQPIDFPDLEAFGNNNYTKELEDLEDVINWIKNTNNATFLKNIDKESISLIGHSRGGGIVLLKSNENNDIKKVITLASVCDFGKRTATIGNLEQWKKEGVKYVLNGRTKQQMPHFYQFYEDFKANEERLNIKKATENLAIPHLLIHGDNDTSVKIEESENLYKWNPKAVYKIIRNSDHVFNVKHPWEKKEMSKELKEAVKKSIEFLKD